MAVVATGFFDGVHLGHRLVTDTLLAEAHRRGERSVVVTFWPHPRTVLQDDARSLRLLTSLQEKKEMLSALGVDGVEVLDFTREFSRLTAEQYLRDVLIGRLGCTAIVLGYDNRMGSDGLSRDAVRSLALSLGLDVISCGSVQFPQGRIASSDSSALRHCPSGNRATLGNVRGRGPSSDGRGPAEQDVSGGAVPQGGGPAISSTKIREALERGEVGSAAKMLGYRYCLHGVVVAGNRLGRTIGYPTANMQLYEPLKLVPSNGVYLVEVETLGSHYYGMTNIGVRPTVSGAGVRSIETHIFDFDELIYGLDIKVRFVRKIRDERRFGSLDELRDRLAADEAECRKLLGADIVVTGSNSDE